MVYQNRQLFYMKTSVCRSLNIHIRVHTIQHGCLMASLTILPLTQFGTELRFYLGFISNTAWADLFSFSYCSIFKSINHRFYSLCNHPSTSCSCQHSKETSAEYFRRIITSPCHDLHRHFIGRDL